jgi:hypothetical protein
VRFHVTSATPLPEGQRIDAINFDSTITNCQVSDAIPGGYGGLSLGYQVFLTDNVSGFLGTPIDFVDLGHVQVFETDEKGWCVFEGRVQDMDSPTGRKATAITATGYGAGAMAATTDMWYYAPPYDGEPTIGGGQLLREVITQSAPLLRVGDSAAFYEPGGAYKRSGQNGRYPNQTIDEIVKAGDVNNNQVVFAVYEHRMVQLYPNIPPTDAGRAIADYYVPMDRTHITVRRASDKMVGVVAVQFADPSSGTSAFTTLSAEEYQVDFMLAHGGLLRGMLVPSSSWPQQQAEFFRDTYLQRYREPLISATVNLTNTWQAYDRMGGTIPYYQVRSGSWIQIADAPPLIVTSTRKDLMKETCSITASNVIG